MRDYDALFIGGEYAAPSSSETITVDSATTKEAIALVPAASRPMSIMASRRPAQRSKTRRAGATGRPHCARRPCCALRTCSRSAAMRSRRR